MQESNTLNVKRRQLLKLSGVLRRNPRFFRSPKLSPVEQLYAVSAQLTIRGYVAVQRL